MTYLCAKIIDTPGKRFWVVDMEPAESGYFPEFLN
jgi:hypothetical protein